MAHRIRVTHLLLAGGLALAAQPALAQEGMLFKNLLEGVVGGRPGDDIEYRQRPPLVVPEFDPAAAAGIRQHPQRRLAERSRRRRPPRRCRRRPRPAGSNPNWRNNPMLSQEELRRGRTTRDTGRPEIVEEHNNYNNQIAPIRTGRELASRQNQVALDQLTYGSEPPRRTLADPPVGYRRPAGSAPLGPGQGGPVEDKQAVGQREFLTGQIPLQ